MKKHLTILLALGAFLGTTAQGLTVRTYVERTHVTPKAGTAIGWENPAGIEIGGFYQRSSVLEDFTMGEGEQSELPRFYEKEFFGAYMSVPIKSYDKLGLKFNVRTGVTNGQNFAITPSVLGYFEPVKFVRLGLGVGSRCMKPTLQSSITFVLK